jgi:hypothetical protein
MDKKHSTFTLTFGEVAENHARMQQIGELATSGISIEELKLAQSKFDAVGCKCEYIDINAALPQDVLFDELHKVGFGIKPAAILIIRGGVEKLLGVSADALFDEHKDLPVDKHALMYGRVVNKHARHNLCFSDVDQDPDYEHGKGRIISFARLPFTSQIRAKLPEFVGPKAIGLQAEGNYYYDVAKCGIGFHGDGERRIVIAARLGASMPIHYQWFYQNKPVGSRVEAIINHGDIYIMSEKAVGTDWKTRSQYTLRHAAGCPKYLKI